MLQLREGTIGGVELLHMLAVEALAMFEERKISLDVLARLHGLAGTFLAQLQDDER